MTDSLTDHGLLVLELLSQLKIFFEFYEKDQSYQGEQTRPILSVESDENKILIFLTEGRMLRILQNDQKYYNVKSRSKYRIYYE